MRRDAFVRLERPPLHSGAGEHVERFAVGLLLRLHRAQHLAGALRDHVRLGVRRAHQGRCHGGLARIEPARRLAEQRSRERVDAHDLAAKRHGVEVGLENLVLAPVALQLRGRHGLADLLGEAAPARAAAQVVVEQARQLHRDGRRAARARVPQVAPRGRRHGAPVDAAVLVEAPVLAQHHGRAQRGRNVGQRDPLAAPHRGVGAHALQQFAVAVEHRGVRRAEVPLHVLEAGERPGRMHAGRGEQGGGESLAGGSEGRELHREESGRKKLRIRKCVPVTFSAKHHGKRAYPHMRLRPPRRVRRPSQSFSQGRHPVTIFTRQCSLRNLMRTGVAFNAVPARRRRPRL